MPRVTKNIRWDPTAWDFVAREAQALGIPTSEYIRVAAIVRATIDLCRRDPGEADRLADIAAAVVAAASTYLDSSDLESPRDD